MGRTKRPSASENAPESTAEAVETSLVPVSRTENLLEEAREVVLDAAGGLEELSLKERAILEFMMDPENAKLNDAEKCRRIGCCRSTLYGALRKPAFHEMQVRMVQEYTARHIAPILAKSVETATTEARDGFQDRRFLMEVGRFYIPRKQQDVNVNAKIVGVVGVKIDDL